MNQANNARLGFGFIISAVCASGWVVSVKAQPRDPVQPATIPQVVLKPVTPLMALQGVALKSVAPLTMLGAVNISASAVKMPPLVAQLRAHTATPQALWDAGAFDADDIVYFVDSLDAWGGFTWDKDHELRRQMVALLVAHGQEQLKQPVKLSPALRLWLADYYWSIGDARCVTLAQSVLDEVKAPVKGESPMVFSAIERLGWYYRDTQQHEKSAVVWLRLLELMPDEGWWRTDANLEAARAYAKAGQSAKSEQFYAKVARGADSWYADLITYDRAYALIEKGQHQSARALLKQPAKGARAAEMEVNFLSLLSASYFKTEEWELARQAAQQTIERYETIKNPRQDVNLEFQVERARRVIVWYERHQKKQKDGAIEKAAPPTIAAPFVPRTKISNAV